MLLHYQQLPKELDWLLISKPKYIIMKREEIAERFMFDFHKHFYTGDLREYKKGIIEFICENSELSDDEFFKKFDEQLGMITVFDKMFSRMYLAKIASSVNTIKVIAIIYLIATIIGGIAFAAQLIP